MTEQVTTWQRFAEVTIKTNDLDPMYEVIYKLNKTKSRKWMGVFLMTFLLYYDAGQAIRWADHHEGLNGKYWEALLELNREFPTVMKRGTERRHMRGENERKALEKLASFGLEPWELLMKMDPSPPLVKLSYTDLYNHMTTVFAGTQFGPYFIWKLYDIFNVCLDMPISMDAHEALKYMPGEPLKVLDYFCEKWNLTRHAALGQFWLEVRNYDHPVLPGRKCSYAETETILCMIKGFFLTKTHVIGDDIQEKFEQLTAYPDIQKLLPSLDNAIYGLNFQRGELQL